MPKVNAPKYICALFSATVATAGIACEHPPLVMIPAVAGISWNKQEVLPTQIQHYLADMQSYLECTRAEIDALADENALAAALLEARNNEGLREMAAVLELFSAFTEEIQQLRQAATDP